MQPTATTYTPPLSPEMEERLTSSLLSLHKERINTDLRRLGAVQYDMRLPETHSLPLIIRPEEHINGVVYGRYSQTSGHKVGRGVLVATDFRMLLVDKKPLFLRCDEITYGAISAITYGRAGIGIAIILHTRMGDIHLRTFNRACAVNFVEDVERSIFSIRQRTSSIADSRIELVEERGAS